MLRKFVPFSFLENLNELNIVFFEKIGVTLFDFLKVLYAAAIGLTIGLMVRHFVGPELSWVLITSPIWGLVSLDILSVIVLLIISKFKK